MDLILSILFACLSVCEVGATPILEATGVDSRCAGEFSELARAAFATRIRTLTDQINQGSAAPWYEIPSKVEVRDGRAYITIGMITRKNFRLMSLLLDAVKHGDIAEIQTIGVISPKILDGIVNLASRASATRPVHIKATIDIRATMKEVRKEIREIRQAKALSHPRTHTDDTMTQRDIDAFNAATESLQVERGCQENYGTRSLHKCGYLTFDFMSNEPSKIRWQKPDYADDN